MSGFIDFALARRQARSVLVAGWLDGGTLDLYGGTRPVTADTAVTDQTLLCTVALADPAGSSTNGVWTGEIPTPAMILLDGTPTWGRFNDDADAVVCDADVGLVGSGAAIEVENLEFVSGALVAITSMTITEG